MAETTLISWADSTVSIWEGCQKTGSPACEFCYAEARNLRYSPKGTTEAPNWGPHAPRREVKSWRATLRKISRLALAARTGGRTEPWFVFVNSLSDFWDNQADPALRAEALAEFRKHPHLTFLLLTKRPQNILKMARAMCEAEIGPYVDSDGGLAGWWPRNVAIGCTVVTQAENDRDIPWLLAAKAALRPAFAFLSMEPLMGHVVLAGGWLGLGDNGAWGTGRIDWVITGGESGAHARPSDPAWFRSLRDQCAAAGIAFHHKQNGEWVGSLELAEEPAVSYRDMDRPADMVWRVGKKNDPCTLDGVLHRARPALAEAA